MYNFYVFDLVPANMVAQIINVLIGIGISLTVIYIILAGFQFIMSMGDKEKTKKARAALTHAIIGFLVVIGATSAIAIMGNTFGITFDTTQYRFIVPF